MRWWALKLSIVIVVIFLVQTFVPFFEEQFILDSVLVAERPWTLLTAVFLHGGFQHLFYNVFALLFFGLILEKVIDSRRLLIVFFVSGLVASVAAALFYSASLGASGAIFGIIGTLAILRPRMVVYVGFIPLPMIVATALWAAGDIFGLFYPSQIANAAHLGGLFVGTIYGLHLRNRFGEKRGMRRNSVEIGESDFRRWEDRWLRF